MEVTNALRWGVAYLALWVVATAVGSAVAAVGLALDGLAAVGLGGYTPALLRGGLAFPRTGLALVVLGALLWKLGATAALVRTLVTAVGEENAAGLDTETVKSDILSVLDDRLADIHGEVQSTRQLVDRLGREDAASEFEFPDELE